MSGEGWGRAIRVGCKNEGRKSVALRRMMASILESRCWIWRIRLLIPPFRQARCVRNRWWNDFVSLMRDFMG